MTHESSRLDVHWDNDAFAPSDYQYARTVETLYSRSKIGPVFYALAIVFCALADGLFHTHLNAVLWFLLPVTVIALFRLVSPAPQPAGYPQWVNLHWLLVFSCVVVWSTFLGWITHHIEWNYAFLVGVICSVSFATAIAHQFSPHKFKAMTASALCFAGMAIVILTDRTDLQTTLYAVAIYYVYLVSTTNNAHAEFYRQLKNEIALTETQRELRNMARTDALTGLANRRVFEEELNRNTANAQRLNQDYGLILLDLDNFKHINDEFGHAVGDKSLQATASLLRETCKRHLDLVARIGGEEFAVIVPDATPEQTTQLAMKVYDNFQHLCVATEKRGTIPISACIGVGNISQISQKDAGKLYSEVDNAVYRAKRQGKNRLVVIGASS